MSDHSSQSNCPTCNEPVKPGWRICPACETRLKPLACPLCGNEVKENWRRCPECEALLVCPRCGRRLNKGETACPACNGTRKPDSDFAPEIKDPVCGLELVLVDGGDFEMGDTLACGAESEKPVHTVTLDAFYITRFPVTQAQWRILMPDNPSGFKNPDQPVEQVTWFDALSFAGKLNESGQAAGRYDLPTEAQWEFAARAAGKKDLYAGGGDIETLAWYENNSKGHPHPVGRKKPNALGLYDMSGNVWEWCLDTFHADAYQHHGRKNPVMADAGEDRVIRGGSWNLDAWSARCARRFTFRADFMGPALGFRLVLLPGRSGRAGTHKG